MTKVELNAEHPLWFEFHEIVGDAALDIVNQWRIANLNELKTDAMDVDVRYAHRVIAEAVQDILELLEDKPDGR
jgi:hypothetical protein